MSTFAAAAAEHGQCPCGLTYEALDRRDLLTPTALCMASGADGNPCNRRWAEHPREVGVLSVIPERWHEVEARLTELEKRESVRGDDRLAFFSKVVRSAGRHSAASKQIRSSAVYAGRCAFCGTHGTSDRPITMAHIVAGASDLDYSPFSTGYRTPLDVKSPRNFLPLCGTEGSYGTCHDEFDKFRITLLYNPFTLSYSIFCLDLGSSPKAGLHETTINVDEDFPPYRRLLAWRTRKGLLEYGSKMPDKGDSLFTLAKFSDRSRSVAVSEEDVIDEGSADS